ncbi:hypothetical protein ACLKA6_008744 [Drosophila palustris]
MATANNISRHITFLATFFAMPMEICRVSITLPHAAPNKLPIRKQPPLATWGDLYARFNVSIITHMSRIPFNMWSPPCPAPSSYSMVTWMCKLLNRFNQICLRAHVLRLTDYVPQLCIEANELPKTDKNPRRDRYNLEHLPGKPMSYA